MTIDEFKHQFGKDYYIFIHTPLGKALLDVLSSNDPVTTAAKMPTETQIAHGQCFFWQATGWRSCIEVMRSNLILGDEAPDIGEPTYEPEETFDPVGAPPAPVKKSKKRKS